jgi:hypothetical protein
MILTHIQFYLCLKLTITESNTFGYHSHAKSYIVALINNIKPSRKRRYLCLSKNFGESSHTFEPTLSGYKCEMAGCEAQNQEIV